MRQIHTPIRIAAILAGVAAMLYALYVRLSVPNELFPSPKVMPAVVVAILAIMALVALILPWKPRARALTGREVTGAASPQSSVNGLLAFGVAVLGSVAFLFLSYLQFAHSPVAVPGMDRLGPLLPYSVSFVMTLLWFGDTVFGRIVTGTATGKNPTGQRFLLIGKRLGVATLMAGMAILLHIHLMQLYLDPGSQMLVTLAFALLFSVFLIPRLPAFTPRADGSTRRLI